jgi:hypothetical protein
MYKKKHFTFHHYWGAFCHVPVEMKISKEREKVTCFVRSKIGLMEDNIQIYHVWEGYLRISSHSADEMYNKKSQIKIFHCIQEMKCM